MLFHFLKCNMKCFGFWSYIPVENKQFDFISK